MERDFFAAGSEDMFEENKLQKHDSSSKHHHDHEHEKNATSDHDARTTE